MYLGLFPDRAVGSRLPCCSESLCQAANSIHLCLGSWKCGRADRESVDWLLKPGVCFWVKEVCVQKEALMSRLGRWSAWFCSTAFVLTLRDSLTCFFLWTVEWDTGAYGFVSVLLSAQIVWQCYVKTVNESFAYKLRLAHVISSLLLGFLIMYLAYKITVFIWNVLLYYSFMQFYAFYTFSFLILMIIPVFHSV